MVDIAEIILRESVRNFVFGEFCKEISPTLQKPAGIRCSRQTKYDFLFSHSIKAIQELSAKNDALEAKVTALENA